MAVIDDILDILQGTAGKAGVDAEWGYKEAVHAGGTVRYATFSRHLKLTDVPNNPTASQSGLPRGVSADYRGGTLGTVASGPRLVELRALISRVKAGVAANDTEKQRSRRVQCLGWLRVADRSELP